MVSANKNGYTLFAQTIFIFLLLCYQCIHIIWTNHLDPQANGQAVVILTGLLEIFILNQAFLKIVALFEIQTKH